MLKRMLSKKSQIRGCILAVLFVGCISAVYGQKEAEHSSKSMAGSSGL